MYKNIRLIRNSLLYFAINQLIILGNTELCDECITPNPENIKGWCVQAKYCPIIGNIVGVPLSRFPPEYQIFIKNSKCSSDGAANYCCAPSMIDLKFFEESKKFCNASFAIKIDQQTSTISSLDTTTEKFQQPVILRENKEPSTVDLDTHPNLKLLSENENCGLPGDGDKVAFGKMTDIDEFPFMALLQYERNAKNDFRCAGTLINKNYVLTAAHCIRTTLFSVRLGEHDLDNDLDCQPNNGEQKCNSPVQDIPIEEIHLHRYSVRTKINDIALIRLKRPADATTNNVGFVCLPTTAKLRDANITRANVAGWGQTENGFASKILLKGSVNVNREREKCINSYKLYDININENYLCAIGTRGAKTTDTCTGDSGGPLLARSALNEEPDQRFIQYGIVSAGPNTCGREYDIGGALYTNVPTYMRWILDNIRP